MNFIYTFNKLKVTSFNSGESEKTSLIGEIMDHLQLPKISEVAQIIWHTQDFYFYFYKRWLFPLRGCQKKKSTTSTTSVFLNLPFLANFYKLTGMSLTTTTTTTMVFDKLTNLQLIFCYSLQLIFCQYCRLIFSDIFDLCEDNI